MNGPWTERCLELERMDLEPLDAATAASILGALEQVNAWLGGVRATLYHVKRFAQRWRPGERIRFIDWGTGGADIPRALVRWGRHAGYRIEVVGVDNNPASVAYAKEKCREFPEIEIVQGDILASPTALGGPPSPNGRGAGGEAEPFDYAISSLSLHHLTNSEVVSLLQKNDRLARRGMIMNDLKRSARAWAWIWALTRLLRAHPIVQNDGPLSVRRAFRPEEMDTLLKQAGLSYLEVKTHFGYRLTLAGEKDISLRHSRESGNPGKSNTSGSPITTSGMTA